MKRMKRTLSTALSILLALALPSGWLTPSVYAQDAQTRSNATVTDSSGVPKPVEGANYSGPLNNSAARVGANPYDATPRADVDLQDASKIRVDVSGLQALAPFAFLNTTMSALPAAGTKGRIVRVTDSVRGLWMDDGTRWVKLSPYIDLVADFGLVGDGKTDNSANFNAAAAAISTGNVYPMLLGPGAFNLGGTVRFTTSGLHLIGAGRAASKIQAAAAFRTGDMLSFENAANCKVEGVTITGGGTMRKSGAGIHVSGPNGSGNVKSDAFLFNVDFDHQFGAVLVDGNTYRFKYDHGFIDYPAPNGYGVWINTVGPQGVSQIISNVMFDGKTNVPGSQAAAAFRITSSGDFQLSKISVILAQVGLLIDPVGGSIGTNAASSGKISDSYFDTTSAANIRIKPGAGGTAAMLRFTNVWSAGAGQASTMNTTAPGIELDGSAASALVRSIEFIGCESYSNLGHGLWAHGAGVQNIFIQGGDYSSNGKGNIAGARAGIKIDGVNFFSVRGIFAGQTPWYGSTQVYGLHVGAGSNNFIVTGNMLVGNITQNMQDDTSGANKVVSDNLTTP
jgi:hypothetical protein